MKLKYMYEYNLANDLKLRLDDLRITLKEDVYQPKTDSFLLVKELSEIIKPGQRVLEIGTGSGILAMVAAKNGAAIVVATDIHKTSILNARLNSEINNLDINFLVGHLFNPIKESNYFDIIVSNITSLPLPPNNNHDIFIERTVNGGPDGRMYLDPLITQVSQYIRKNGYFLLIHSNFSDISKTYSQLKINGFDVNIRMHEFPLGTTSAKYIKYYLEHFPQRCRPVKKKSIWYQKIAVFIAKKT
jgi:release factor glutamine methyltransferase